MNPGLRAFALAVVLLAASACGPLELTMNESDTGRELKLHRRDQVLVSLGVSRLFGDAKRPDPNVVSTHDRQFVVELGYGPRGPLNSTAEWLFTAVGTGTTNFAYRRWWYNYEGKEVEETYSLTFDVE